MSDQTEQIAEQKPAEKAEQKQVRFTEFALPGTLQSAIQQAGFEFCTPIQAESLPHTLDGNDLLGKAQTGTGKTAAFLVTIIAGLLDNPIEEHYAGETRSLILAPTRELAMQIAKDAEQLSRGSGLTVLTLVGGVDYEKQQSMLEQASIDILVATPGRLQDFLGKRKVYLDQLEVLVIDEADRMLDMGFIPQVRRIIQASTKKGYRQTLLFSATFSEDVMRLVEQWTNDPVRIEIEPDSIASDNVDQRVYLVTKHDKFPLLCNLIKQNKGERIIVFANRRDTVRTLEAKLKKKGLSCGMLSGEVQQNKRVRVLEDFRSGKIQVLVATDVAGRGIHINDVSYVVNYTLPEDAKDYIHRIGRTGRAGSKGSSISFACEDDSFILPEIEQLLGAPLECEHPPAELLSNG
ncbi:MAG: DEAD/DEAH box helicase [Pseudomonadales bacterium]|nr:DEAD/DEAH box helicase [Pseudomonadales bacterium]